jgi:hypothetical protein
MSAAQQSNHEPQRSPSDKAPAAQNDTRFYPGYVTYSTLHAERLRLPLRPMVPELPHDAYRVFHARKRGPSRGRTRSFFER